MPDGENKSLKNGKLENEDKEIKFTGQVLLEDGKTAVIYTNGLNALTEDGVTLSVGGLGENSYLEDDKGNKIKVVAFVAILNEPEDRVLVRPRTSENINGVILTQNNLMYPFVRNENEINDDLEHFTDNCNLHQDRLFPYSSSFAGTICASNENQCEMPIQKSLNCDV